MATTSSNSAVVGFIALAAVSLVVKLISSASSPTNPALPESQSQVGNDVSDRDFTRNVDWNAIRGEGQSSQPAEVPNRDFVNGVDWDKLRMQSGSAQDRTSRPRDNFSHDEYRREIENELGSEYVTQFDQLTRGDFTYSDRAACYMVYAFQHGWKNGYWVGRKNLDPSTGSQIAYSQIGTWEGVTSAELKNLKSMVAAGWRAGYEQGARDLANGALVIDTPQPAQPEFRKYFQPSGLVGPPRSPDEDLWGDLRNAE